MFSGTVVESEAFERAAQRAVPDGRLLRIWPLEGGISAGMTALEIQTPDGRVKKLVLRCVKQDPQSAGTEFHLLRWARTAGLSVPEPLFFGAADEIFADPYLLLGYVEGEPAFTTADLDLLTGQMAEELAKIHTTGRGLAGGSAEGANASETGPVFPRPLIPEFVRAIQCSTVADPSFEVILIRDTLRSAWPFPHRNPPTLLHGDYWPGNILWRDGRLAAVVDWEDAALGDPLADLAIARLDLRWIFGRKAMETFTARYQALNPVDFTALPYWDLCAALRLARLACENLAEWVGFFAPYGRGDISEHSIRADYQDFVERAFEQLG